MPIAILDVRYDLTGNATAACVVLRSFDSSESLEERTARVRVGASHDERELRPLRAVLEKVRSELQVVVIDGYVWLDGTTRPGPGARLYQALGESVAVLGIAKTRCAGGEPEALEVRRGRASSPLFVTAVGFPPPVIGKLVKAMHGRGRVPWALARAAELSAGRDSPRRFVRRAAAARPSAGGGRPLPRYARVVRSLRPGDHRYLELLPHVADSPALRRIAPDPQVRRRLVKEAVVQIRGQRGYAFVDVEAPCIVVSEWYYRHGGDRDLYLDLLHELTHLRQLAEGFDLWDERFEYVDRPTEVEGYAVAIEEGRRLGMTEQDVFENLSSPWMTEADVRRLIGHVDAYLGGGELPNLALARQAVGRKAWRPW